MAPIVDGIEQKYAGQLAVKRVNAVEANGPEIMEAYNIPGHPVTLLFNQAGTEVRRFVGPDTVKNIELAIEDTLKNSRD